MDRGKLKKVKAKKADVVVSDNPFQRFVEDVGVVKLEGPSKYSKKRQDREVGDAGTISIACQPLPLPASNSFNS